MCRRARCSAGPVCGVCASCALSVACRRACVGGRMCAVVLAAQLLASGSAPSLCRHVAVVHSGLF